MSRCCPACWSYTCDCESDDRPEPEEHTLRFKRHEIAVTKDAPDKNWYIVVRSPSGLRCYDGWWSESAGRTWQEAVAEAKREAMLTPSTDEPRS